MLKALMRDFLRLIKASICLALRVSMLGLKRGPHITRYAMYRHLSNTFDQQAMPGNVLSISHSETLCSVLGFREDQLTVGNYPEVNFLDLPYPDCSFDFVVSDQVLEHVEGSPHQAIHESYRVLKPGGIAIHTTCFINPIHAAPRDYWRFTPDALRLLCREFSEYIDVGGWGNHWIWYLVWLGLRYDGVPESKWHPIHLLATYHDPEWCVATWIIARK